MNFFEAQERARKSSRLLVWWFILAVIGVIVVIYLSVALLWPLYGARTDGGSLPTEAQGVNLWNPELFLWTAVLVGGTVLIGSLTKLSQLSGGGKIVAQNLGGRAVEPDTYDPYERRLLNVVEEMAIASGVPVPEVWIMDGEPGINAFAAGTDPANAVIGVTRGTLERLNRAELQGVVAHEFSHILNGDMKLNIRLMGWIFGLVMISVVGRFLMESLRHFRGSRDSKNGGGLVFALLIGGLILWLVGSVGVLFARMIQAAISRQREFLADASAVQFTRLPDGISGALKKIGGFREHGRITAPAAAEARHMFFAGSSLNSLMATHPPLEQRIKAIDPSWNGSMLEANPVDSNREFYGAMGFAGQGDSAESPGQESQVVEVSKVDQLLGNEEQHFTKDHAKFMLLGLLVAPHENGLQMAEGVLKSGGYDVLQIGQVIEWNRKLEQKSSMEKLTMVDLSLAWLRKMSADEARGFIAMTQALIEADGQIDMFEFMLQQVIRRHVEIGLGLIPVPSIKFRKLAELEPGVMHVLSAFGNISGGEGVLENAFQEYREQTGREPYRAKVGLGHVAEALKHFDASTPLVKQQILRLCSSVVVADGRMDDAEMELLRATAEAIGVPIPQMPGIAALG